MDAVELDSPAEIGAEGPRAPDTFFLDAEEVGGPTEGVGEMKGWFGFEAAGWEKLKTLFWGSGEIDSPVEGVGKGKGSFEVEAGGPQAPNKPYFGAGEPGSPVEGVEKEDIGFKGFPSLKSVQGCPRTL